jgi:hypothetical protein
MRKGISFGIQAFDIWNSAPQWLVDLAMRLE